MLEQETPSHSNTLATCVVEHLEQLVHRQDVLLQLWRRHPDLMTTSTDRLMDTLARCHRELVSLLVNVEYNIMHGFGETIYCNGLRKRLDVIIRLRRLLCDQLKTLQEKTTNDSRTCLTSSNIMYSTESSACNAEGTNVAVTFLREGPHRAHEQANKQLAKLLTKTPSGFATVDTGMETQSMWTLDGMKDFAHRHVRPRIANTSREIQIRMLRKMMQSLFATKEGRVIT